MKSTVSRGVCALLVSVGLLVSGCLSVRVTLLAAAPAPAAAPAAATTEVALLDAAPARPHLAIARLEVAESALRRASRHELERELRRQAAALGADAVVLEGPGVRRDTGVLPAPLVISRWDRRIAVGTAIVYQPRATG
jgi:uncharacterized protein YbjQ (UPF0145 family)